jgi:hypothetical protein
MGKVKVDLSLVDLAALLLSLFSTTHFTVTSISSVVSHFLQKIQQCINNRHEQYKEHQTIAPDHCSIVRMVVTNYDGHRSRLLFSLWLFYKPHLCVHHACYFTTTCPDSIKNARAI